MIVGEVVETPIYSGENILFNNLQTLTDERTVDAKPDFYDGAHPDQLSPHLREELADFLVPSRLSRIPILPNFFVETKGSDGSFLVIKRQACYGGALGARGMERLRTYG
jgi:hypothetical protein